MGALYPDNLVLIADPQEGRISNPEARKAGMGCKGLCVNMNKTKFMDFRDGPYVLQKFDKYPCALCSSGVSKNSIVYAMGPQDVQWHDKATGRRP